MDKFISWGMRQVTISIFTVWTLWFAGFTVGVIICDSINDYREK